MPCRRSSAIRRRSEQGQSFGFDRIIHRPEDSPLISARSRLPSGRRVMTCRCLITGASGTGKELLARAVHHGIRPAPTAPSWWRIAEPCRTICWRANSSAARKGAYTGAYQDRIGLFELADSGTIFLDEIGETSPAFQVKLLRVSPGGRDPSARRPASAQGQCPGHLGDQSRSAGRGCRRPVPSRSLLPARRLSDSHAVAEGTRRWIFQPSRPVS